MPHLSHRSTRGIGLGVVLLAPCLLLLAACGGEAGSHSAPPAGAGEPDPAAEAASEVAAPDPSRAVARATERWKAIVEEDWIQVYDYAPKIVRARMTLQQFLQDKANHHYENPSQPKLLLVDGDTAYLEVQVLWTPTHPQLWQADNAKELEGKYPEEIGIVEEWHYVDGDWYHFRNHRTDEFLEQHPEARGQ